MQSGKPKPLESADPECVEHVRVAHPIDSRPLARGHSVNS